MSARVRGASRHLEWVTSDGDKQLMLVSLQCNENQTKKKKNDFEKVLDVRR